MSVIHTKARPDHSFTFRPCHSTRSEPRRGGERETLGGRGPPSILDEEAPLLGGCRALGFGFASAVCPSYRMISHGMLEFF